MGNAVRCASAEAGQGGPQGQSTGSTNAQMDRDNKSEEAQNASSSSYVGLANNPGSMDELHKKCKDVFPICFDGAKFMFNKGLSNHFQVSHTITLSSLMSGYRYGVTYVGTKQLSPQEAYPVCLGDTDFSGNLSATVIHQFTDRIRCKFASQFQGDKILAAQLTSEYRSPVATYSLTVANPDFVSDSGLMVGSYLRRVTPRLDVGVELIYQRSRQLPGAQLSILQYAGRYTGKYFTASGTIGRSGLHLCYFHKQEENMQFGIEWETNLRMQESVATFAYQFDLPKANTVFRASVDTNWTVGAVVEKKLFPLPFTLALSGLLNHVQNKARVGIGLIVG